MKILSLGLGVGLVSSQKLIIEPGLPETAPEIEPEDNLDGRIEKRYQQLVTQMNFYNPNFDPR